MKPLLVLDRVMMSHDVCSSETSLVLTVALLQRLKMEPLIPAPVKYGVCSVIKFLKAQSIAPIELHRQLCQVYGHTVMAHSMGIHSSTVNISPAVVRLGGV